MELTRLSIKRPLTILMIILGFIVLGYRSLTMLQVDRMPKTDLPYVSVVVVYPGASPEDVADEALKPVENAVAGISGIDEITSQANENFGYVLIKFNEGVNGDQAAIDVSREVDKVRGDLPDNAEEPTIIKADLNAQPIMQLVLSGSLGQDTLYDLADTDLKPRLQTVAGVASVSLAGGREREIQIYAAPRQLAAYSLSLDRVQQALLLENVTVPVGSIEQGPQKNAIRSVGEFTSLKDIEGIIVAGGANPLTTMGLSLPASLLPKTPAGMDTGGQVYLRDVATVQAGFKDTTRLVRYNGQAGVLVTVVKTSDANAIDVANGIRQVVEQFEPELPDGVKLDIVIDDTHFTRESVSAVGEDLLLAVLITGIVMLLFLHTIHSSVIVMLSVPTSIIATFLLMYALGFSLNTVTLMALTVAIGILVDDSIVVLENTERHLKLHKKPRQAALDGRAEIGLAAITITLVIVVVYLPVAFISGIVGQIFRSYGVTIAVATIFSLLISFTLTPMLAAFWLKDETKPVKPAKGIWRVLGVLWRPFGWLWQRFIRFWEAMFTGLSSLYALILGWTLKNAFTQFLVVGLAAGALVAGIYLVGGGMVGNEFLPLEDDGRITLGVEMPAGSSLAATDRAVQRVEQIIRADVPETSLIVSNVGTELGSALIASSDKADFATIILRLVDKNERSRSTTDVVNALRPALAQVPDAKVSFMLNMAVSGMNQDIEVRLYGPDREKLIDLASQAETAIRTIPGAVDIRNTGAERSPETQLVVDRERAKDVGLSPGQVARTLRTAVNGSHVGDYQPEGQTEKIDLTLRMNEAARRDLSQLLDLPLGYVNDQVIVVGQVAQVQDTLAPARLSRANRQAALTIKVGSAGRANADVTNDIEAALNSQVSFPAGYNFQFTGQADYQRQAFQDLTGALVLSILLIYMLLVALYQSWLQPLAIMFALPVTLVGAFGGLWLTGNTLNVMSLLGIIMLAGIVVKNAILLVDFTNILRQERGFERKAALVEAGRLRLRPILMTTFAIIFSLFPLLLGQGAGAELRAPLAAVVIGGNVSSTLLTLILVPVMYNFLDWGGGLAAHAFRSFFNLEPDEEEDRAVSTPAPQPMT
ncbi:MAG: efflux RND transporter permease subunit [Anaerolineales bacterium]|nr:efflux RND transporter permease subunit [Anaerolineales bacterium]